MFGFCSLIFESSIFIQTLSLQSVHSCLGAKFLGMAIQRASPILWHCTNFLPYSGLKIFLTWGHLKIMWNIIHCTYKYCYAIVPGHLGCISIMELTNVTLLPHFQLQLQFSFCNSLSVVVYGVPWHLSIYLFFTTACIYLCAEQLVFGIAIWQLGQMTFANIFEQSC